MKEIIYFEKIIKDNFYENYNNIYFKDNSRKQSNLGKLEKDEDGNEIKLPKAIFYPNKATKKMLSTKGTEIDYMD